MKRLYTAQDPLTISHLKNILETGGVECVVRNTYLAGAAGEIPPIECWPELWVVDDDSYEEAEAVIKQTLAPVRGLDKSWKCRNCGETIDGRFSECWNCGSRPWLGRR